MTFPSFLRPKHKISLGSLALYVEAPCRLYVICEDACHILHRMELGAQILRLVVKVHPDESVGLLHPAVIEVHHREYAVRNANGKL